MAYVLPILEVLFIQGRLPGTQIYLAHFLDLVLNAPFFLFVMLCLFQAVKREGVAVAGSHRMLLWLAAGFVLLFFEGHGIHYAANSLAPLVDRGSGPQALVRLNYFYDEILGHYMFIVGQAGLLIVLMLFEAKAPNAGPVTWRDKIAVTSSSIVSGLATTLIILEGQFGLLGILAFAAVAVIALSTKLHHGWYRTRPMGTFMVIMTTTVMVCLLFWGFRYGGFIEPLARPFSVWVK